MSDAWDVFGCFMAAFLVLFGLTLTGFLIDLGPAQGQGWALTGLGSIVGVIVSLMGVCWYLDKVAEQGRSGAQ